MLFTFSALISNIYWCGIVSHQLLMARYVALAEINGAANAAPAAPMSTPNNFGRCDMLHLKFADAMRCDAAPINITYQSRKSERHV